MWGSSAGSSLCANRSFVPGDDYQAIPCDAPNCSNNSVACCGACGSPICGIHNYGTFSPDPFGSGDAPLCRSCRELQAEERGEIVCRECLQPLNNGDGYGDPRRPLCGACHEAQDDWEVTNAR